MSGRQSTAWSRQISEIRGQLGPGSLFPSIDGKQSGERLLIETRSHSCPRSQPPRICASNLSDCSSSFRFFEGNPADVDDLGLAQVDETRVAVWWTEPSGLRVTVVSTSFGAPTSILVPGFTDAETGFGGGAVVSGPESTRLLFARISEPDLTSLGPDSGVALPDGTRWVNRAEVLSVGVSSAGALSFDMSADVQPWDPSASCTAVGTPYCAVAFLLFTGRGTLNEPSLLGITGVAGFDEGDAGVPVLELCARGTTPRADGPPEVGPCQELPSPAFSAVDRGTVATAATFVTSGFRLRELPLSPEADGSPFVNLPGISLLLPGVATYLSMHGARGVALGNAEDPSGFDLTLQRLGCEP